MTDQPAQPLPLGKLPPKPAGVTFKLSKYIDTRVLPTPPKTFGHEDLVPEWGLLGNDRFGDCVEVGAANEVMLWNRMAGRTVPFSTAGVLSDYGAITGFDPRTGANDNGTYVADAASYRRKVGVVDANGNRHKILAYLSIDPGDLVAHYQAIYLFGAVGIGFQFPGSAWAQFANHRPWKVNAGSTIEGGHYVPLVARRHWLGCVTWGRVQGMSRAFLEKYNDESIAYVSEEMLTNGRSPEGFDLDSLLLDLAALPRP